MNFLPSLLIALTFFSFSLATAPSYFTRFGSSVPDTVLFRNDDGSSPAINFTFQFSYFGNVIQKLFVNNNGMISFGGAVSTFTPSGLANIGFPLIGIYWSDVDTRCASCGYVYYRETSDPIDLDPVTLFVQQTKNAAFIGVKMFVITWYEVGYFANHFDKTCTFQLILVADNNNYSAVIFNYGLMQWTTGDASSGVNGFNGEPSVVGFSDGTGLNFVQMPV